eukprot:TRINITY_DN26884_c0_g1_i1.p1 TRINITY_DN26884_c0_g1~~TRINITY_DN26884_c0_g1_i1.p1  ORF type:complete len:1048 (+),score=320.32 TRINITY_DN26884_c0_g1_i1:139-3282(+)
MQRPALGAAVLAALVQQGTAQICTADYQANQCPTLCTGYLADKCCKWHGRSGSMLTINFPHALAIKAREDGFERCTGATLNLVDYQVQGTGGFRPLFEVGLGAEEDAEGVGIYDSYMTQAMAVPTFADHVEDLTARIRATPELQWTDILPYVRRMGSLGTKQLSLPYDLDFMNVVLRDDLRDQYERETGKSEPRTFEELADFAEYWYGKDLNGDGVPDFGICSLNGAGPGGPQAVLMAVAASKLQYLGSQTGIWFDTEDPNAVPLFDNPAFRESLVLTRRLWMASADDSPGGWTELHEDLWHNGRCSVYMWLTGSVALVLTKAPIRRCASYPQTCAHEGPSTWANRTVLWEPRRPDGTYWEPRRVRPMGSERVLERSTNTMKACTPETPPGEGMVTCPYLDPEMDERDGVWINRAPYYYSAYQHSSVSIRLGAPNGDLIWDFMVYANLEAAPVVAQALGPTYLDPFRRSHITPENRNLYLDAWTDQMYDDLRRTFLWAGSTPNSALPLSVPGQEDYELTMEKFLWQFFLPIGTDCTTKDDCKCRKYVTGKANPDCGYGWGSDPDAALWAQARAGTGSISVDQYITALTDSWNSITAQHGGGVRQIDLYRQTIGLEPLPKGGSGNDAWVLPTIIALGSFIGIIFIVGGVVWVVVTYKEKRKLQQKREAMYRQAILSAEEDAGALGHPMVLCSAENFAAMSTLTPYEVLRDQGKLIFLDSLDKIKEFKKEKLIVFLSHQWLGWGIPDPDNIHHNAMQAALTQVLGAVRHIDGREPTIQDMYIWCDFVSIAQEHRPMQMMAVSSLPVYSSIADAFVIVAPTAKHKNSGMECNAQTYSLRGWCRAEMLAKVCGSGLDSMYIVQGEGTSMAPVTSQWLDQLDLRVFEGQFSCCALSHKGTVRCDRESLMSPILGLYSLVLKQNTELHIRPIYKHIDKDKERFFPPSFSFATEGGTEERELFGPLVTKMEQHVTSGQCKTIDSWQRAWQPVQHSAPPPPEQQQTAPVQELEKRDDRATLLETGSESKNPLVPASVRSQGEGEGGSPGVAVEKE